MKSNLEPPELPFGYGTPEYFSGYKVGLDNGRFDISEARQDARIVGVFWTLVIEAVICLFAYAIRSMA